MTSRKADNVVEVRFSGGQARVGPLTVGQANVRELVLRDDPTNMNICLVWSLPAGTSPDRIASLLATLVLRHESLRTTYPQDPELRQVVAAEGTLAMTVYSAGLAEDIAWEMRTVRFDPQVDLPVRIAVLAVAGEPVTLILVLCHMAVDAATIDLFRREWTDLLADRTLPPPAATQPVDLALMEQSPRGRRRLASSLRYWEMRLRTMPQAMFAVPGVIETKLMHRRLRVRSHAAAVALAAIAARTEASPPTVMLAAMCAVLGRRLGQRTCVVATLAANRFLPELTDYFGTVAQDALMSVDVDADTFDEIVRRVRSRSVSALRHSGFDHEQLSSIMRSVERDRGTHWARDCVFNDLTTLSLDGLPSVPKDGQPAGGTDPWLDWSPPEPMFTRLTLWAIRLTGEVELALWADERCLPEQDVEEFVADMIRLLIAAADQDVDLTDATVPAGRGDDWYLIDSCWIELATLRQLVADALPGRPTLVTVVPDELLGHRIDCYVAAGADVPDLAAVHADCVAALADRPAAMAPHRYVVCEQAPEDVADLAAWRRQPVVTEGTGRASPVPGKVTA